MAIANVVAASFHHPTIALNRMARTALVESGLRQKEKGKRQKLGGSRIKLKAVLRPPLLPFTFFLLPSPVHPEMLLHASKYGYACSR